MSGERCAELVRDIQKYDAALRYLKGVYLESLEKDHPSLRQLVGTGAYLHGRISGIGRKLQVLKKVETATR